MTTTTTRLLSIPLPLAYQTTKQLRDGLTYTLSGADAGYFHVVPATGQILTEKKLDYEAKNEFKVTLKAMDPEGLYDTIVLTINVNDVDEVPVPDILRIAGDSSHDYEENGTDAVGEYTVAAGGDATPGAWTLEGADASSFRLTGSGDTPGCSSSGALLTTTRWQTPTATTCTR